MLEIFITNPAWIIFSLVFMVMFVYGMKRNLAYSTKVSDLAERLTLIAPEVFADYADIHCSLSPNDLAVDFGKFTVIAGEFTKGYDLILIEQPKAGSTIPIHKHKLANELVYVLEGSLNIFACENKDKSHDCTKDCKNVRLLKKGDWSFIKAKVDHCVEVVSPTKYLVIAKPPLFSRIGKLYEFFLKKKN